MKILIAAAVVTAASFAAFAAEPQAPQDTPSLAAGTDAQSLANPNEVGQARRAYRAACQRYESAGFCDCVTAGMAQALNPSEVRLATRTIRDRITAQGDAAEPSAASDSMSRIERVESHYNEVCAEFRK